MSAMVTVWTQKLGTCLIYLVVYLFIYLFFDLLIVVTHALQYHCWLVRKKSIHLLKTFVYDPLLSSG